MAQQVEVYSASGSQTPSKKVQPGAAAEDTEGAAGDLEAGSWLEADSDVTEAGEEKTMLSREKKGATLHPLGLSGDVELRNRSGVVEQTSVPHVAAGGSPYIKWVAVAVLLFQNAGTNVIMPLARRTEWNSQSGVICQEIAKGVVSVLALLWGGGFSNLAEALRPTPEALKTAVPAMLFLLQNNLQYIAAGYLSPTLFGCLYQLKILTVALLSVLLLHKKISCIQWAALAMLVVGAALVVLGHVKPNKGEHISNASALWRGVVVIITATCLSGLGGVYFEKLLKGSTVTLAARNLQLACYSAVIGIIVFSQSGGNLGNFYNGYTAMVWFSICNNAFGGLIVAVIIKYADNIWKNFATTMAIVLTSFVQAVFLGGSLGPGALLGVALVVAAVLLYSGVCSYGSPTPAAQPPGSSPEVVGRKAGLDDSLSD